MRTKYRISGMKDKGFVQIRQETKDKKKETHVATSTYI